jgi:DNA transformation protein and related proteins
VEASRMFGGYGLYQDEIFFGIIFKGYLYFKTNEITAAEYRQRKMKPFRPNAKQTLKSYYRVPVEIIEDRDRLTEWAKTAIGCQKNRV